MADDEDLSFLNVTNLDDLTREEADRRSAYWASKTFEERLGEMQRLNFAKWGEKALGRMDKSFIAVVHNVGTPDETEEVIYFNAKEKESS